MNKIVLILLGLSVAGFVFGLAAKSRAIKKKEVRKSETYARVAAVSLILMFVFAIIYNFTK